MKWKPIKTVPKDGTLVDLWHKNGFRVRDIWWAGDEDHFCGRHENEFSHWIIAKPQHQKSDGETGK